MWLFRWRTIAYHFMSSLTAIASFIVIQLAFFPELRSLERNVPTILAIVGISVALSALGAFLGAFHSDRYIRTNLDEISLGARNLSYGNLDYRLGFSNDAQFDAIIVSFNDMASRIQGQVNALQKLAEENEQLLQETKITAISEERQRLARDLHDAVSQQLFAISMMAATAAKVSGSKPSMATELIQEISTSATRAQSEMRALLLQLRPLTLQKETLSQALQSLAIELESKQTIKCTTQIDDVALPKNIENQLFRIAQEGLSNVLRHSKATQVDISLKMSDANHRVLLIIQDNGTGFDLEEIPQSAMGIRSIKERSILLGGTAQWLSVPKKGTKLEIRIPITTEREPREA